MKIKPLSKNVRDIILGSLLGDGSLAINPKYKSPRFSFRHSTKQKEYFFWKVEMLKEISGESCYWLQGSEKSQMVSERLNTVFKARPCLL